MCFHPCTTSAFTVAFFAPANGGIAIATRLLFIPQNHLFNRFLSRSYHPQ